MKKPEEIKKGLECCGFEHWEDKECDKCPYISPDDEWCKNNDDLRDDALAYIQQLESPERRTAQKDRAVASRTGCGGGGHTLGIHIVYRSMRDMCALRGSS